MAEKAQERAFVELARNLYPWFPPGELKDHEATADGRCIGRGSRTSWFRSRALFSAVIATKNIRVPSYRANVPHIWLLIASSLWQFASSSSLPPDIGSWEFDFDFDKIQRASGAGSPASTSP